MKQIKVLADRYADSHKARLHHPIEATNRSPECGYRPERRAERRVIGRVEVVLQVVGNDEEGAGKCACGHIGDHRLEEGLFDLDPVNGARGDLQLTCFRFTAHDR